MTEWLAMPIVQGGAVALLAGVLIAIFTGRLVPRWQVTQLRASDQKALERQAAEIEELWKAYRAVDQANRELILHSQDLMETGRITRQLFASVTPQKDGDGA
jgi:hypothetical protein